MGYNYSKIRFDAISSAWKGTIDPSTGTYQSGILHDLDLIYGNGTGYGARLLNRGTSGSTEIDFIGMTAATGAGGSPAFGGGLPQGFARPTITLNYPNAGSTYWFNSKGVLVSGDTILVIAHELSHAIDDSRDPLDIDIQTGTYIHRIDADMNVADYDFKGDAVRAQNVIARELGLVDKDRVSYIGSVGANSGATTGISYTDNNIVTVVRFGNQRPDITNNNIDHTNRADSSADLIFGFSGEDYIHGGGGNDHLYGGDDKDTMYGGLGHDRLFGEEGNDILAGNAGSDLLHGGYNATVSTPGQFATDGEDTADYLSVFPAGSGGEGIRIDIGLTGTARNQRYANDPDFAKAVFVKDLNPNRDGGVDTLISIETILATNGDDRVRILKLDPDVLAGPNGQGGVSFIDLGSQVSARGDVIDLSRLNEGAQVSLSGDGFVGSLDGTRFLSVKGAETVLGSRFDDDISGDSGDNIIIGGGGQDRLSGGGGIDRITGSGDLFGDSGKDVLTLTGRDGSVTGGTENDIIRLQNTGYTRINYKQGDGSDRVLNQYSQDPSSLNYDNYRGSEFDSFSAQGGRGISLSIDLPFNQVTTRFTAVELDSNTSPGQMTEYKLLFGNLEFFNGGERIISINNVLGSARYDDLADIIVFTNVYNPQFSEGGFDLSEFGFNLNELDVVIQSPSASGSMNGEQIDARFSSEFSLVNDDVIKDVDLSYVTTNQNLEMSLTSVGFDQVDLTDEGYGHFSSHYLMGVSAIEHIF